MAFVQLGGDDGSRPTYFEVLAADRLVPSLRAAVVYALSVLSQRRSWLHRLLEYVRVQRWLPGGGNLSELLVPL
jgi:peroxin-12